jgi:amidase
MELEGFATSGVVSHTVADTAAALDVIGVADPLAWYTAPPPPEPFAVLARRAPDRLRVGLLTAPAIDLPVDPVCVEAAERTAQTLAGLGHEIVPTALDVGDVDAFVSAFTLVWNTGSADLPMDDWDAIEPLNAALRAVGRQTDSIAYVEAVRAAQRFSRLLVAPFGRDYDVLVTPTMATPPPRCGSVWEGADADPVVALLNCYPMAVFTSVFNVVGLPAISLPVHQSPDGLPIGVQLAGGPWQDALVLSLAHELEQALPWSARRPPLA